MPLCNINREALYYIAANREYTLLYPRFYI